MSTVAVEHLVRDCWPAEVYMDGMARPHLARVWITDRRVIVASADGSREVHRYELALAGPVGLDRSRNSLQGHLSVLTDEGELHVNRSKGCGCHSPLRVLEPPVPW